MGRWKTDGPVVLDEDGKTIAVFAFEGEAAQTVLIRETFWSEFKPPSEGQFWKEKHGPEGPDWKVAHAAAGGHFIIQQQVKDVPEDGPPTRSVSYIDLNLEYELVKDG